MLDKLTKLSSEGLSAKALAAALGALGVRGLATGGMAGSADWEGIFPHATGRFPTALGAVGGARTLALEASGAGAACEEIAAALRVARSVSGGSSGGTGAHALAGRP